MLLKKLFGQKLNASASQTHKATLQAAVSNDSNMAKVATEKASALKDSSTTQYTVQSFAKLIQDNLTDDEIDKLVAILAPDVDDSQPVTLDIMLDRTEKKLRNRTNARRRLKYKVVKLNKAANCPETNVSTELPKKSDEIWDPRKVHPTTGKEVCEIVRRAGIFEKDGSMLLS
jgi:hypothetical protein